MCAVWQNVHGYSVSTEDQILTREQALALAFHIAVTLTQPVLLNQKQEVQTVVGETGVHMGSVRQRDTDSVCTCVCVQLAQGWYSSLEGGRKEVMGQGSRSLLSHKE